VLARRAPVDAERRPDVDLRQLGTVRGIPVDALGTEHIVLQAGFHTITLRSQGASMMDAPVNLTFLIDGLPGLARGNCCVLPDCCSIRPSTPSWSPKIS
jgi:hypothetical protein